jgi:hypothetical protein
MRFAEHLLRAVAEASQLFLIAPEGLMSRLIIIGYPSVQNGPKRDGGPGERIFELRSDRTSSMELPFGVHRMTRRTAEQPARQQTLHVATPVGNHVDDNSFVEYAMDRPIRLEEDLTIFLDS